MFAVRTADKCFTEAHYDNLNDLLADWWRELTSKTHYYTRVSV
jgi:hypothetical protein